MNKQYLIVLAAAVALAGCASNGSKTSNAGATPAPDTSSAIGANSNAAPSAISSDEAALEQALQSNKVYFAFDSADINADGEAVVANYGKYLLANPTAKVRLEGNTDERGSRSYNMALGERRANAVKSELEARGVAAGQTSVISYGSERPADPGHDEAAWAKNRRVEIDRQ